MRHAAIALLLLAACAGPPEPSRADDPATDAIYTDFVDGKFDAAGHPIGAFVLQGDGCAATTGWVDSTRVHADPFFDAAGVICDGQTDPLGLGLFTINVRAALFEDCDEACASDVVLRVRALDAAGTELASREVLAPSPPRAQRSPERETVTRSRHAAGVSS